MKTANVKKKVLIYQINHELDNKTMAEQIARRYGYARAESVRVMLTDMLNERRFAPKLAAEIKEMYGIDIPRPAHLEPLKPRRLAKVA